jgi:error-prone DNA polymerase
VVQRRGSRGFSVVGAAAWNLADLLEVRREEGLEGVAARLAEADGAARDGSGPPDGDGPSRARVAGSDGLPRPTGSAAGDPMRSRSIRLPTGFQMHPWADLRPAGEGPAGGKKLWHQSPGSAG